MASEDADRAWLELEYSPTRTVPGAAGYLRDYRERSAAARRGHADRRVVAHGPDPAERTEVFRAPGGPGAAVVFVHGGGWDSLTLEDSAFLVPGLLDQGITTAVVDYPHAPGRSLDDVVDGVAAALRHVARNGTELGADPERTVVVGTSAGAQLLAAALDRPGTPAPAGAVLCSGIFDLDPLRHTYYDDLLALGDDRVRRCSPARTGSRPPCRVVLAVGADEGPEFRRQTALMDARLRSLGAGVTTHVVPGRNHFDLPYDTADPSAVLGREVTRMTRTPDRERT